MNDTTINPNLDWYYKQSKKLGIPLRCPIAEVSKCPRYYLSLSHYNLINKGSIDINLSLKEELNEKWKFSDVLINMETTVSYQINNKNRCNEVQNFCPEVTDLLFEIFACEVAEYVDDIDKQFYHKELKKKNTPEGDLRWEYRKINPCHYSECVEFSIYGTEFKDFYNKKRTIRRKGISQSIRWKVFERDNFSCIYCGVKGSGENPLEVDHKISIAEGGTNDLGNLATSCTVCNSGKGKRSIKQTLR